MVAVQPDSHGARWSYWWKRGLISAVLSLGLGCSQSFPADSISDNVLGALALYSNFSLTPSSLSQLAAGATYKFTLTGGAGNPTYSVSNCNGTIDASTGLLTAPTTTSTCIVTATDRAGGSRSATVVVRDLPALYKSVTQRQSYYRFDGNANGLDNINNATVQMGTATYANTTHALDTTVYSGNSYLQLDGATYLDAPGIDPAAQSGGISAEIWFRITNADALHVNQKRVLIGQGTCATPRAWIGIDADTSDEIGSGLGGVVTSSGVVPEYNKWYHVAVTVSGSTLSLYVNGVLRKTAVVSLEPCLGGTMEIGALNGAARFLGEVDEAAVYFTALSSTQVAQRYLAGLAKTVHIDTLFNLALLNLQRGFSSVGGQSPYTYSLANTNPHGSITSSGNYTAPGLTVGVAVNTIEKIQVTDAHGNTSVSDIPLVFWPISAPSLRTWIMAESIHGGVNTGPVAAMFDLSGNSLFFVPPVGELPAAGTPPQFQAPSAAAHSPAVHPALVFNGANDRLTSTGSVLPVSDVSAFGMFKRVGGNGGLISHGAFGLDGTNANNTLFSIELSGGFLQFFHENGGGADQSATGTTTVPAGTWSFLGGIRRLTSTTPTPEVYMDTPTAEVLGALAAPSDGGSGVMRIGAREGTGFSGMMSEVTVYYRALDATEVAYLHCYYRKKYGTAGVATALCP